jgi:YesN/AraC family two-component response regulator
MAKILIVDDNREIRESLREILERSHHTVIEAPNGNKAIEILRSFVIDLIITDIVMPEKDGLDVIKQLKEEFPQVKVIAYSGGNPRLTFDPLMAAKILGAIQTFQKPFPVPDLLNAVERLVGSAPQPR